MTSFWKGKRVLVPGGAGFIGSSVVDLLVTYGARVRVLDDLSSGDWSRLEHHGDRIQRTTVDLVSGDATQHFLHTDAVLNLAGRAPGLMLDDSRHERLYQENVRIADAVLQASLAAGVSRLLVVSSSCVYPDNAPVPTAEEPLGGTSPEQANRGYGRAKREIEARATLAVGQGTSITIARPFNACGPRDQATGSGAHVIPSLLTRVLDPNSSELLVWGSGNQSRSFIDSRDVASALLQLTEKHPYPDPVNIGSDEEITMRELVETLMRLCSVKKVIRYDTTKPEGALRKACNPAKLIQLTGFQPKYRLSDSLAEIVAARRSVVSP